MGQDGGIGLPTPVSELVDRETQIGEVLRLLGTSRLTTLTGPGGIGKTRLAIAAAHAALAAEDAVAEFADGAVFVPLAELAAGEHIARAVAAALDLSGPEGFCDNQVAGHVALGRTNRRIAEDLVIWRTYGRHTRPAHPGQAPPGQPGAAGGATGRRQEVRSRIRLTDTWFY